MKQILLTSLICILLIGLPYTVSGRAELYDTLDSSFSKQKSEEASAVIEKAQREGRVRVIVDLDLSFKPEGQLLSSAAVQAQRFGIQQAQQTLIARLGISAAQKVRFFKYVPQLALEADSIMLDQILEDHLVVRVHEDGLWKPTLSSSIPHIGADDAWAAGYSGEGQVIAILDTGMDRDHPFLAGKVVSEACYSNYWEEGVSLCPGGIKSSITPGSGEACSMTIFGCDHGTHVAGIAAGNGVPFSGVARDSDLISIQVYTRFEDPYCLIFGMPEPCVLTYFSDVISGLERVYELRNTFEIAAVNLSLGGGENTAPEDCDADATRPAIQNLRSVKIATVVASGNEGYRDAIGSPACVREAISVGSTDILDDVSDFTSVAYFLDFFAPGDWVYSSIPGGGYDYKPGTSMAAPHVAGAWAVMRSKAPGATVDFLYEALSSTGVLLDDDRSGGTVTNIPRIQLDQAIDAIFNMFLPLVNK